MPQIQRVKHDIYPFIDAKSGLKDEAKGKTVLVTGGGKGIGRVSIFNLISSFSPVYYYYARSYG